MTKKRIAIGCDHAGFKLKLEVTAHCVEENSDVVGIVICGSGNGINMTVNKHQEIRSALCWTKEIASLARQHNDANILALPARFISTELGIEMVDVFLETDFEGGRHQNRVNKIACS